MSTISFNRISIIIPVLNEASVIGKLLEHINGNTTSTQIQEILIVDGGSEDNTVEISKKFGAKVIHSKKGRAAQIQ